MTYQYCHCSTEHNNIITYNTIRERKLYCNIVAIKFGQRNLLKIRSPWNLFKAVVSARSEQVDIKIQPQNVFLLQ